MPVKKPIKRDKGLKDFFKKNLNNGYVQNLVVSLVVVPIIGLIGGFIWHLFGAYKNEPKDDSQGQGIVFSNNRVTNCGTAVFIHGNPNQKITIEGNDFESNTVNFQTDESPPKK